MADNLFPTLKIAGIVALKVKTGLVLIPVLHALCLSGCSSVNELYYRGDNTDDGKSIVYCNGSAVNPYGGAGVVVPQVEGRTYTGGGYGSAYHPGLPGYYPVVADASANMFSEGDVEVYSIDSPVDPVRTYSEDSHLNYPVIDSGTVSQFDSDVMIYPFDEEKSVSVDIAGYEAPVKQTGPVSLVPALNVDASGYEASKPTFASSAPLSLKAPEAPVYGEISGEANRIYFSHDSAVVGDKGHRLLTELSEGIGIDEVVMVEGYASSMASSKDPIQRDVVNLQKALDRAFAVSRELIRKGIPASNIMACGYGDTTPPEDTEGQSDEAASRRVEITSGY